MIQAYTNYARSVIEYFNPNYLAIGIEVNVSMKNSLFWESYKKLHTAVYDTLKNEYPNLPIFATISLAHLDGLEDNTDITLQKKEMEVFLEKNDIIAVSAYPYGFGGRISDPIRENFLKSIYDLAGKKPIAISETGSPSYPFRSLLFSYDFSEEYQLKYFAFLLDEASNHNFVFIINWAAMDFDPLVESLPGVFMREMARLWQYTGFVNSA